MGSLVDGCDDSSQLCHCRASRYMRVSLARPLRIRRLNALPSTTLYVHIGGFQSTLPMRAAPSPLPVVNPTFSVPVNCGVVGRPVRGPIGRGAGYLGVLGGPLFLIISSRLYPSYPYPPSTTTDTVVAQPRRSAKSFSATASGGSQLLLTPISSKVSAFAPPAGFAQIRDSRNCCATACLGIFAALELLLRGFCPNSWSARAARSSSLKRP